MAQILTAKETAMNSSECVIAIYDSYALAREGMDALRNLGYPMKQVSLVTHDVEAQTDFRQREAMQFGDQTANNAAVGAGVGGLIGLLVGATVFTLAGAGLVFIAGPIGAGLAGTVVGGFLGAMSGWGVHSDHVRQYEERVRHGKTLVVAYGDPDEVLHAQRELQRTDAEEVHLHAQAGDESPEVDDRVVRS
jgi:uncharacterized membrane protein